MLMHWNSSVHAAKTMTFCLCPFLMCPIAPVHGFLEENITLKAEAGETASWAQTAVFTKSRKLSWKNRRGGGEMHQSHLV